MVAVQQLLTLLTSVSLASGLCVSLLNNPIAIISQKLDQLNIIDNTALVSTLLESLSSLVFPNLLSDLDSSESDTIKRNFSIGLSSGNVNLKIEELSLKYGYPLKSYTVVTQDGYKLKIYRIQRNGPPVFVMHGLLSSSDDFMSAGPESALAYLLADSGYDVWLGNARGNKHSRQNVRLSPSNARFWDFSWHEIGIYDLPVMIDYVLKETGQTKLKYIGHSQGTTSFYVMASERPEYNKKISVSISLAPVAYTANSISPLLNLISAPQLISYPVLKLIGVNEVLTNNGLVQLLKTLLCGQAATASILCSNLLFLIAGFDYAQLNVTNLPVIYSYIPAGAANKQLIHYGQVGACMQFGQFNYGYLKNLQVYGSLDPPKYDLDNIEAPVSLVYSDADWLSSATDVEHLRRELPNVVDYHKVNFKSWNHLDYLWAKDFKSILYGHIKDILNRYN